MVRHLGRMSVCVCWHILYCTRIYHPPQRDCAFFQYSAYARCVSFSFHSKPHAFQRHGPNETRTHAHAAAVCCTFFTVVLAHNHACFCVALLSSTASLCYGHFCASAYDWCASMLAETVAKRHKVSGAQFCLLPMTNLTGIR